MNILFISPYAPTPIRVRPYQFVRALARLGHAVTLATVVETEAEREALQTLEAEGIRVVTEPLGLPRKLANLARAVPSRDPAQSWFSWSPALAARLSDLAADADVVHVEHLRGARYGLRLRSRSRKPIVWDSVDCISALFESALRFRKGAGRWVTAFELPRTRRYEARLIGAFDRVAVTSPRDRAALMALSSVAAPIEVITNGVDLGYFSPAPALPGDPLIAFTGKLSYHANIQAALFLAEEVMPAVWERRADAHLVIAGSRPPKRISALPPKSGGRIRVTGEVPHMNALLRGATVSVAPLLYGAGVQNKVLEAMACGLSVVATPLAVSALEGVVAGRDCLVADSVEALAEAIVGLLDDPNRRRTIGLAGRAFVEAHHDWDEIAKRLVEIYENARAPR